MITENAEKIISAVSLEETSLLVIIRKIKVIYYFINISIYFITIKNYYKVLF
jgi:hypothetical protein